MVGDKETSKNSDFKKTSERKPGEIDLDFLKTGVFETPPQSHGKITITITGNSLHFHRDTNFWFETTITLPAGKDPKQFHATIKDCPPSQASPKTSVFKGVKCLLEIFRSFRLQFLANPGSDRIGPAMAACGPSLSG